MLHRHLFLPAFVILTVSTVCAQTPASQDKFFLSGALRIHYLDWGNAQKPPFILLHGIGRTAHSFDHIAPRFQANYHIIAMDLRGHGDSAWSPEGAYLVEDDVKDVEALADQLKLTGIVILGYSTGGRVAQVYAGLHPDRVSRLVVEDVGPERPTDISDSFARTVQREAGGWASEKELVASLMKSGGTIAEAQQRNHAHFATNRREDGRVVWKRDPNLVKGFVPTELWRFVSKITAPTIYVLGGKSTIVPAATQEKLKKTLPRIQIVIMPGLGHYPHLEAPEEYLRIVEAFLAGKQPGA